VEDARYAASPVGIVSSTSPRRAIILLRMADLMPSAAMMTSCCTSGWPLTLTLPCSKLTSSICDCERACRGQPSVLVLVVSTDGRRGTGGSGTHSDLELRAELECTIEERLVQVAAVDDKGWPAIVGLEVGERGRVELLVVDVPPDARAAEPDGLRREAVKDAKVGQHSAEVGRDLRAGEQAEEGQARSRHIVESGRKDAPECPHRLHRSLAPPRRP